MGREAKCTVRTGVQTSKGKALLETSEVIFRGSDLRLKIPFQSIQNASAAGGALVLALKSGDRIRLEFEDDSEAKTWAHKIQHPLTVLDKLGVKAGQKVSVVGTLSAEFMAELKERADSVTIGRVAHSHDVVFFAVESASDLNRLTSLQSKFNPTGAIWIVRLKGPKAPVPEAEVRACARAAGLVDTKVVAFSATHTADRYVIPVERRATKK